MSALRAIDGGLAPVPKLEGKLPPHDLEAEAALLSALLMHPERIAVVRGMVEPADFFSTQYQAICECLFELSTLLVDSGRPISALTIGLMGAHLADAGKAAEVAGPQGQGTFRVRAQKRLAELMLGVAAIWDVAAAAQRVKDLSRLRDTSRTLWRLQAELYTAPPAQVQKWLDGATAALRSHAVRGRPHELRTMGDHLKPVLAKLGSQGPVGVETGIAELDNEIGGFTPDLWTVTAPPGGGKTAFGLGVAIDTAARPDEDGGLRNGVGVVSIEMPAEQLVLRGACREARVDVDLAFNRPDLLDQNHWRLLNGCSEHINRLPLIIEHAHAVNLEQITGLAHRFRQRFERAGKRLTMLLIDYFQLLGAPRDMPRGSTREAELNHSGLGLARLANELQVPVVLLAQLTKSGKSIAECSALEKHTPCWINLKLGKADKKDRSKPREVACDVRKRRNGGEVSVAFWFHGLFQVFSDTEWLR